MIKSAKFMKEAGLDAERIDIAEFTPAFSECMRKGLAATQKEVPMLPTFLFHGAKPKTKKVAVIDAGGTNFRTALVSFEGKSPVLERVNKHAMPGAAAAAAWEEFIGHVADCVLPLLGEAQDIGFCFSYPIEIDDKLDGKVLSMTKQVKILGAEGKMLGAALRRALAERGAEVGRIVVLNDTPAVLLAGKAAAKGKFDGFVGLVAGTGCNTCCELPGSAITKLGKPDKRQMLVNLESGSFGGFARGECDLAMDSSLPDTGEYLAEKMISGRYLGPLCLQTLKTAAGHGVFSDSAGAVITGMTELPTPLADSWVSGRYPEGFNSEDKVNLVYIINELFERAARCVACMLCGILEVSGAGRLAPACIAVDGSLFSESALFRGELERFMDVYAVEIMGRSYKFVHTENMTLIGAAFSAVL